MEKYIFIFMGDKATFPSGAFSDFDLANAWIRMHSLSGSLSKMPLNIGLYEWAVSKEYFEPKKDYQKKGNFIQRFNTASIEHWHCKNGVIVS